MRLYQLLPTPVIRSLFVQRCFACFFAVVSVSTASRAVVASDSESIQRLAAIWDMQRTSLQSGEFHCRVIEATVPNGNDLSPEYVKELNFRLSQDINPVSLAEIAWELDPRRKGKEKPWSEAVYIVDGESYKANESVQGLQDLRTTHIKHRDYQIRTRGRGKLIEGDQIDIFQRGRLSFTAPRIKDFAFIPPESFLPSAKLSKAPGISNDSSRLWITGGVIGDIFTLVVNPDSGFIHEMRRGKVESGNYMEILQLGETLYEGGLVFPNQYFKGSYVNGRLSHFTLRVIDDATPNAALSEEDFLLQANKEDTIYDRSRSESKRLAVKQSIPDVVGFVETNRLAQLPSRRGSRLSWLIVFNVLIIGLILVAIIWRRRLANFRN